MISRNFIKSSAIYTLAGALPMASAFLLLPFYLAFLPTTTYGALSLYLSVSLFVQIVVMYSFDNSIYIHYHEYKTDPRKLASFISSAFIFMLIIAGGLGVVVLVGGQFLFDVVFPDESLSFYPYGILAIITGVFQALFKVYTNLLQSRQQPAVFLRSNLFLFSMIAGLTIAGLYVYPDSLIGPIGSRVIAGLLASGWVLYSIYKEFGLQFNYGLLSSTFGFNHYSFIYQVQQWFINNSDKFIMLFAGLSLASIGVYDFALKCLIVIEVLMNALNNSFYPKVVSTVMAQPIKSTTPEINRYYHGLIAAVMLMVSGAIFVLPFAVNIFDLSKGYNEAIPYFPYIAAIFLLKVLRIYFAFPYAVLKYTKPLPVIYTFITALKILLMIVLVKQLEIYGLVIASMVSLVVELIVLRVRLVGKFMFTFNVFKILIAPLLLLLAILIAEPLWGEYYGLFVHAGYVALVAGFLVWVYRNEIKQLTLSKVLK